MRSEVINIKIDPATKKKAKRLAQDMGFNLSTLLNAYLRQFIRTKSVAFSAEAEEPSEWLINELKEAEKDRKAGWVSPAFDNADDAIAWLRDPKAKYQRELNEN